jgi:hypothetical protein
MAQLTAMPQVLGRCFGVSCSQRSDWLELLPAGPEEHDYALNLEFYGEVDDTDIKQVRDAGLCKFLKASTLADARNCQCTFSTQRSASSRWSYLRRSHMGIGHAC